MTNKTPTGLINVNQYRILSNIQEANTNNIRTTYSIITHGLKGVNTERRHIHQRLKTMLKRGLIQCPTRGAYILTTLGGKILEFERDCKDVKL